LFTWLLKFATENERVEGNLRNLPLPLSGVNFSFSGLAIAAPSFPLSAAIAAPSSWSRDPPPADLLVDPADLLKRETSLQINFNISRYRMVPSQNFVKFAAGSIFFGGLTVPDPPLFYTNPDHAINKQKN
jgi:hypothetical protein